MGQQMVQTVERFLTWRLRRKARRHIKQSRKNVVVDWIEAFLQAALFVLLVNQYLLQAYQIPSGSMIDTLLLGDRIFVNKVVYGPELLPGVVKLPGFADPERAEVIIFENPSYISRGTGFTILQRVLYMVTLSLVDIDRDESGDPRAQLLIKRAVGTDGDRIRAREGELELRPAGALDWQPEHQFIAERGLDYTPRRTLTASDYEIMTAAGRALGRRDAGLPLSVEEQSAISALGSLGFGDPFHIEYQRQRSVFEAQPEDARARMRTQFIRLGWYVPAGRILPVGDNRDNSRDGRYFGAVDTTDVLGRAMFIYWPLSRAGAVR